MNLKDEDGAPMPAWEYELRKMIVMAQSLWRSLSVGDGCPGDGRIRAGNEGKPHRTLYRQDWRSYREK